MKDQILSIIEQLKAEIIEVNDLESLKQIKAKYTSKSDFFNNLKESIKTAENKQEVGAHIKLYTSGVNSILDKKKEDLENSFFLQERENPLLTDTRINLEEKEGVIHPLTKLSFEIIDFFEELNYQYAHGIEVEEEFYNFDVLNIPTDHPARAPQDTFYLEQPRRLLRTHATTITARELQVVSSNVFRSYSIGPVFRNDDNDATHSFQFNQIDIFNIGEDISIGNLKWTIDNLLKHLFNKDTRTRYRPSYFPFTEPSFEVDVSCPHCNGTACNVCSHTGWIEILGSGMINNQVIKNVGKNPENFQGFAAGIGLERIAMMKWPIKDIRDLYNNRIDFLKEFKD